MPHHPFLADARRAYVSANAATLGWMLSRPALRGNWLNTKMNSLTLRDYDDGDGWRAPGVLYGWIQGRGLEALVEHARFFHGEPHGEDSDLAARLDSHAERLYRSVRQLFDRHGHGYFAYDEQLNPVYPDERGLPRAQHAAGRLYTYSDVFVLKGLVAASARFDPGATRGYVKAVLDVVQAVEDGRFVMDERQALTPDALDRQADDYGPRMIVLGAAALLGELGFHEEAAFGTRFIEHILAHHVEDGSGPLTAGTTRDVRGGDHCNAGHAIEFAGFALEFLGSGADPVLATRLEEVLIASWRLAFARPGLRLSVSVDTGEEASPYRPWWSLPETVRAAALAHTFTASAESLEVWRAAHSAFFTHYWRQERGVAYQTLTESGPVDYVPATPDLDPGYHTGLSFLGAIRAIDRLSDRPGEGPSRAETT